MYVHRVYTAAKGLGVPDRLAPGEQFFESGAGAVHEARRLINVAWSELKDCRAYYAADGGVLVRTPNSEVILEIRVDTIRTEDGGP